MIDDKVLNAYEYFHASSAFSAFLIDNEFNRTDASFLDQYDKELYVKLLVTHSALLLALFKEEVVTKDNNKNISLNIYENAFDVLMSNLCTEDGNKFKLGDMSFDSKKEVFDLLRNKLLHGDYAIDLDGYKVVLNNKGLTGSIEIIDLVETCKTLCNVGICKLDEENQRTITFFKRHILEHGPDITNLNSLKRFMNDVHVAIFRDKPVDGYKRNDRYAQMLNRYYKTILESYGFYENRSIKNAIDIITKMCALHLEVAHIDIKYDVRVATSLPEFDKVKKFYVANKEFLDKLEPFERRLYMAEVLSNILYAKEAQYSVLASGLLNNMKMLSAYVSDVPLSEVDYIELASTTYVDDMSIAAVFNQFYACYHYELDEIYSNGVGTSLRDVISGKYLDFSKLNLDDFYVEGMTIDNGFNDFTNQLEHLEKSLEKINARKVGSETAYRKYLDNVKVPREEAEQRLLFTIEEVNNEYNKELELYKKAKEFMDTRYHRYVRNYNIIAHIRNAFAHGNVRIMNHTSGDTLNDRTIVIEDNYEGNNTYRLVISYTQFSKLFKKNNIDIVYDFIADKAITIGEEIKKKEKK